MFRDGGTFGWTKRLDIGVVHGGPRPECDVRTHDAHECGSTGRGQLPHVLAPNAARELIPVGLHGTSSDYDDCIRTQFGDRVGLGGRTKRDESQVYAVRRHNPKIGPSRPAGFTPASTLEFVLGLDIAFAAIGVRALTIFPIGYERPIAEHDMLERSHGRKLFVESLAIGKESEIEAGFHWESLGRPRVSNP
jgi:hypothetical protein